MARWQVTITGADDGVEPAALAALSEEFPFVEWGILFSPAKQGSARFPGAAWLDQLLAIASETPMRLSAHLCGQAARQTARGERAHLPAPMFQRVQLNGFEPREATLPRGEPFEFILQTRGEGGLNDSAAWARERPHLRASLLYDPSGGRGLAPSSWPLPPPGLRVGYAGGISPENVAGVLASLGSVEPTWIDLESGARDEANRFDLGRVRRLLEQVARLG